MTLHVPGVRWKRGPPGLVPDAGQSLDSPALSFVWHSALWAWGGALEQCSQTEPSILSSKRHTDIGHSQGPLCWKALKATCSNLLIFQLSKPKVPVMCPSERPVCGRVRPSGIQITWLPVVWFSAVPWGSWAMPYTGCVGGCGWAGVSHLSSKPTHLILSPAFSVSLCPQGWPLYAPLMAGSQLALAKGRHP